MKKYSDWLIYPQLYVNGNLVGCFDIVREMSEGGDLADMLLMQIFMYYKLVFLHNVLVKCIKSKSNKSAYYEDEDEN